MSTPRPLLAATLIVRDEAAALPRCLAALAGVVDEICVHDTGSLDDTVRLAREAGARVVQGYWNGNFSRARNEALAMTRATWALVVDADETLQADAATLRAYLAGQGGDPPASALDAITVQVVNTSADGTRADSAFGSVRIFRRSAVHYEGAVHEQPVRRDGRPARAGALPPEVVHVRHRGYAQAQEHRAKAERNLAIARAQLDELVASGSQDRERAARVLLDLGRSAKGAGRLQEAVDAFEALRELVDGGQVRAAGTALLAEILLQDGDLVEAVPVLAGDLRAMGADPRYCDWLRAQACARLGRHAEALDLVRGIDALVDPMGVDQGLGDVLQARVALALHAGHLEEAGDCLARAIAGHGPATGTVELLLELWAGREDELGALRAGLHRTGRGEHLPALVTTLRTAGAEGARVADRLAPLSV